MSHERRAQIILKDGDDNEMTESEVEEEVAKIKG